VPDKGYGVRQGNGVLMREEVSPAEKVNANMHLRRLKQAVVGWIGLNAVFVIIWAMSGRGPFWPGWIMLLSAVAVVLRFWRRGTMSADDASWRARSRGR
jgi:hypothetical protein